MQGLLVENIFVLQQIIRSWEEKAENRTHINVDSYLKVQQALSKIKSSISDAIINHKEGESSIKS